MHYGSHQFVSELDTQGLKCTCLYEYISKYSFQELQFVASFYVTLYLLVGIFNLGCLFILKIILISITH